jgi:hypothetical protein
LHAVDARSLATETLARLVIELFHLSHAQPTAPSHTNHMSVATRETEQQIAYLAKSRMKYAHLGLDQYLSEIRRHQ